MTENPTEDQPGFVAEDPVLTPSQSRERIETELQAPGATAASLSWLPDKLGIFTLVTVLAVVLLLATPFMGKGASAAGRWRRRRREK